jgi:hypothetical protein
MDAGTGTWSLAACAWLPGRETLIECLRRTRAPAGPELFQGTDAVRERYRWVHVVKGLWSPVHRKAVAVTPVPGLGSITAHAELVKA